MTSPDPAAQRSLVGAVLSRKYRLAQRLGEGGMGEVYAADGIEDGLRYAVKLLHPEFLADPSVLGRFLEEAAVCQRLIHPNIVRVIESRTAEDGTPYLVMELLEGVPLSAYTQNGGRVPAAQAIPILQGILAGLAAAHAQGIVHRDLKPENVFLTRDKSGGFVVKVVDFGIAKVMDAAGGMGSKTRTGMLLGTPAYMSPEQIKNAKDVDARADLWSAGVMFYEMLTGRTAFPAPTEYARLSAVLNSQVEPLERTDPALAPLASFIARALQKDRTQRFGTALEMSRALAASMNGERVSSSPARGNEVDAHPLSRLPDVPSLFVPSMRAYSSDIPTAQAQPVIAPRADTQPRIPLKTPSGTLTSPSSPPIATAASPVVMAIPVPQGETLPSKDLPVLAPVTRGAPRLGASSGIAPTVVAILVAAALFVGFALGFAVARFFF